MGEAIQGRKIEGVFSGRELHSSRKPMHQHPSVTYLYKRVRHHTNIGEHEEAFVLMTDLLARKFAGIDRHPPTGIAQPSRNPSTEGCGATHDPATVVIRLKADASHP